MSSTHVAVAGGDARVGTRGFAVLRVALGLVWLHEVAWKVPPDFGRATGTGLYGWFSNAVEHPAIAPYSWLVEHLVLPNIALFGWLAILIEASIGGFLVMGLATRLWGVVGAIQAVALVLPVLRAPDEWAYGFWLVFAAHLAITSAAAGRTMGLDGVLRPQWLASDRVVARALAKLS